MQVERILFDDPIQRLFEGQYRVLSHVFKYKSQNYGLEEEAIRPVTGSGSSDSEPGETHNSG